VMLEDMRATENPVTPTCTDGARAAPPEDCGGDPRYERLLTALRDPGDPAAWPDSRAAGFDSETVVALCRDGEVSQFRGDQNATVRIGAGAATRLRPTVRHATQRR
jgi:hypothetical protein